VTGNNAVSIPMQKPFSFGGVSASVTQDGMSLTAITVTLDLEDTRLYTPRNLTYQWERAASYSSPFTPVSGATGKTFTPTENGVYKVKVNARGYDDICFSDEINFTVINVETAVDWGAISAKITTAGNYVININDSFPLTSTPDIFPTSLTNINVIINGNNNTITLTGQGCLLHIRAYQTVTMNKLTLIGNNSPNPNSLVKIEGTNASLTMNGGAIKGNIANGVDGGGVSVTNGGTFTMEGGASVSNNESRRVGSNDSGNGGNGGGVYVYNGSTFTMKDNASVHDNTAPRHGGGVFIHNNVTFTMEGSASVRNNEVTGITGVPNYNGLGGGVYVNNGTFIMKGSASVSYNEITGSSSTTEFGNGGGVDIFESKFTMQDSASVSGNSANDGGGVIIDKSTFTMNGGSISGNIARNNGGGVNVLSDSNFTMNGGTISRNTADQGGGVYNAGTFHMFDGVISGNTADGSGGGIHTGNGTFVKTKGTIYGKDVADALQNNSTYDMGHSIYFENLYNRLNTIWPTEPLSYP